MTALDEKLVLHLTATFQSWLDEPRTDGLILDAAALATRAAASVAVYQSSASKAALPEEMADIIIWLNGWADDRDKYAKGVGSANLRKAATLLSALASRAQRLERIAKDEQALKAGRDAFFQAFRISGHGEWVTSPENTRGILNFALRAFAREALKDTP